MTIFNKNLLRSALAGFSLCLLTAAAGASNSPRVYEETDFPVERMEFVAPPPASPINSVMDPPVLDPGVGRGRREKEGFCRSYTRRAVRAQERNEELDCGFTGPRWHFDEDNHYKWCLNAPRRRADFETDERRSRLRDCRGGAGPGREGYCRAYARRAVDAQRVNMELDCGFGGPRWHRDRTRHYEWCMRAPRSQSEFESEGRRNQLRRCRIRP